MTSTRCSRAAPLTPLGHELVKRTRGGRPPGRGDCTRTTERPRRRPWTGGGSPARGSGPRRRTPVHDDSKRMDIGLLVFRLGVGATLAAHGAQKLFGWFGGGGLEGTTHGMQAMGSCHRRPAPFWRAWARPRVGSPWPSGSRRRSAAPRRPRPWRPPARCTARPGSSPPRAVRVHRRAGAGRHGRRDQRPGPLLPGPAARGPLQPAVDERRRAGRDGRLRGVRHRPAQPGDGRRAPAAVLDASSEETAGA